MSKRIDFGGRDWAAHAQDTWLEFAGHPGFPDHLRIVFVAYGRRRANGHARLDRGELAAFLVRKDGSVPDRRTLWHALNKAISLGFLTEESRMLCLVVSQSQVQGGAGSPDTKCRRNHGTRAKDVSQSRPLPQKDVNPAGRSGSKDVRGSRPLTLVPYLSSNNQTTAS
ncbi:MAG TPA: hypothetical protein PLZ93_02260 [Nocardioides sp.]|uniref:hypothetical protein n=1 Tax=uncultured Nocardioides sp. TaxID=198441 RepID=UPI002612B277|nr:hypothetical protein [uncultured Nocardioides sp.]HRD61333.1 hypothetical protein [Nocardioides sp.]HRI94419.1 hypothetical protein [Nocardioides sp.]HRK44343.1 hypothetical protein [Nocardioides sp.]